MRAPGGKVTSPVPYGIGSRRPSPRRSAGISAPRSPSAPPRWTAARSGRRSLDRVVGSAIRPPLLGTSGCGDVGTPLGSLPALPRSVTTSPHAIRPCARCAR